MVGDHGQDPTWLEAVAQKGQRPFERAQLVVHSDSDRLEKPREIARSHPRAESASNRVNEIIAYMHRFAVATTRDFPSEAVGPRLVSVVAKNVG